MGWLGKVIGGTIGLALAGPVGAVAGAVFGHMFDSDESQRLFQGNKALTPDERAQMTFFVASFSMLAKIARADGRVVDSEITSVRRFMSEDLKLNSQSTRAAEMIFKTALNSQQGFDDFAAQFYQQFNGQPQLLEMMIDILIRVSVADGKLNEIEERLIRSAVGIFQINIDLYQKIRLRYIQDSDKYYAILGCDKSDSNEQVKQQYRKLVRDFHPDTIASKGLPEEFIRFATDKFREIQGAYDIIKKERNL
ncbi:MAG: co-chaperone DjlA [Desulfobacterales bacterium]|jgi:DnaJ like chaperone protein|nr:co-chaperone DjlA [Desulfobacterales bacterium]